MTKPRKTKAQLVDGDLIVWIDGIGRRRPAILVQRRDPRLSWTIKTLDTGTTHEVSTNWVVPL